MKKKITAIVTATIMSAALLMGCGSSTASTSSAGTAATDTAAATSTETAASSETAAATESEGGYTVGINQFAEHGSLDNCREGFLQGLAEEGIVEGQNLTVIVNNADADMGTVQQISSGFADGKVDMICAIATPSAQASYNAAMDKKIPVVFTAVTDPVAAQLASEDGTPVGEVTGTSDVLPVESQLKMIRETLPEAKKIGILYTLSEANSVSSIKVYQSLAEQYGFEIVTAGISNTSEVQSGVSTLLSQNVDCFTNLTDNTVVSALPTVLDMTNQAGIPVFGSEIEQVKIGCLAAEGLDYVQLGVTTGKMAAKILKGEASASEMNFETIEESELYLNQAVADKLGITVPESMTGRAVETFTEIAQQ